MPKKPIPVEVLIDLKRRLASFALRSHERRLVIAEAAHLYGVSEQTLYRALAQRSRPKALRRSDRGARRVLPQDQMERYCELVARASPGGKNRDRSDRECGNLAVRPTRHPLQFEKYLTLAFEEGYRVGQKPVGLSMDPNGTGIVAQPMPVTGWDCIFDGKGSGWSTRMVTLGPCTRS